MHSESKTVADALLANAAVAAIVGEEIYQEDSPVMAKFPRIVYSESQSPAASADNTVIASAIIFDVDAFFVGSAWDLATAITTAMAVQGYICSRAQSAGMTGADGTVHQVSMTFTNTKEV